MTTYLGKSCSFGFPRVPFVHCRQFMYLVISLLVLSAGCGIWLYQFLIIAYLFTLCRVDNVCKYLTSTFGMLHCLRYSKLQYRKVQSIAVSCGTFTYCEFQYCTVRFGNGWNHLYSTTSGMCIQFDRMPSEWQYIDYPCSGRKRISAMKHKIKFDSQFQENEQRVAWHSSCFDIWRWERINPGSTGSLTFVSARFSVPFSATGYPLSIFLFTTRCCGWGD